MACCHEEGGVGSQGCINYSTCVPLENLNAVAAEDLSHTHGKCLLLIGIAGDESND